MSSEQKAKQRPRGRPVLENLRNAGPPLQPGERSQPHRITADEAVNAWFGAMTARQRGDLVAQLMTWQDRSQPAVLGVFSGPPGERSLGTSSPPAEPASSSRPLNAKGQELFARMKAGAVLVQDGHRYRLEQEGHPEESLTYQTPYALISRGLLVEFEPGRWRAQPNEEGDPEAALISPT